MEPPGDRNCLLQNGMPSHGSLPVERSTKPVAGGPPVGLQDRDVALDWVVAVETVPCHLVRNAHAAAAAEVLVLGPASPAEAMAAVGVHGAATLQAGTPASFLVAFADGHRADQPPLRRAQD